MIIKNVNLETVIGVTTKNLPFHEEPEFAFAGKSNVGKSSLINALMNRKSYARTSSAPGKTQTINYYKINDELFFVDLPGYGYAKVSKAERERWAVMIEKYLNQSPSLKAVFCLVDARHDPTQNDVNMYHWVVESGLTPIVIATKADKIKRSQYQKQVSVIRKKIGMAKEHQVILFSSESKMGREKVYDILDHYVHPELFEVEEESAETDSSFLLSNPINSDTIKN